MKIKLFENFGGDTILDKPFVKKIRGKYFLPNVDFTCFDLNCLKTSKKLSTLNYSSLIRFYLFVWLLKYNGTDDWTNYIISVLKDPSNPTYDKVWRNLNQMGNNNAVLKYFKSKLGLNIKDNKDDNIDTLTKMDEMKDMLFNDMNFREITSIVSDLTKKATESETNVKFFLKRIWGKYYKINDPTDAEDIKGVDLWRLNIKTGDRDRLQVKNISESVSVNVSGETIAIKPSRIDLRDYYSGTDTLKFDYLILYDKFREKLWVINGKAIFKIKKYDSMVLIILKKWDPKYNPMKEYDIPKRFT